MSEAALRHAAVGRASLHLESERGETKTSAWVRVAGHRGWMPLLVRGLAEGGACALDG